MATQDFISAALQRELDARIAAAGGDVLKVRREVEAEVQALEQQAPETHDSSHQVQVALLRGELLYLDSLAKTTEEPEEQQAPNLWQRLSNLFRGRKEATA